MRRTPWNLLVFHFRNKKFVYFENELFYVFMFLFSSSMFLFYCIFFRGCPGKFLNFTQLSGFRSFLSWVYNLTVGSPRFTHVEEYKILLNYVMIAILVSYFIFLNTYLLSYKQWDQTKCFCYCMLFSVFIIFHSL